jgi:hypothetical protein
MAAIKVLDDEINTTAVAYTPKQRDILAGTQHVAGVSTTDVKQETITLPPITGRPPALTALLQEARDIISHPYEGTWWVGDVTKFIQDHPKQIAAEIEARNRGYTLIHEAKRP